MSWLEPRMLMPRPREVPVTPTSTTWRYLGERAAADLAYRVRFGGAEAPEPTMMAEGRLAYTLPTP